MYASKFPFSYVSFICSLHTKLSVTIWLIHISRTQRISTQSMFKNENNLLLGFGTYYVQTMTLVQDILKRNIWFFISNEGVLIFSILPSKKAQLYYNFSLALFKANYKCKTKHGNINANGKEILSHVKLS